MARLKLSLLGALQITLDGQIVSSFAYKKARALLAYLAAEAERPHQRDALVGLLWPELPDAAARTNLRQALADMREAIGDASATPPFLLITRATIQFNPAINYDLDVAAFTALLTTCEAHAHRRLERCRSCAARMEQALALYQGDFLAEFVVGDSAPFEEWQLRQRERLHQRALAALVQLADYHERRGEDEQAGRYAQRQIELEPWREEAHRQLMRLLAHGNQRSAALAQYETCRRMLMRELEVEPEAETTALYKEIRDKETKRQGDKQNMQAYSSSHHLLVALSPRHNFPAQTTPLIGREAELADLGTMLENADCRLITIVGPGGIGKTRLALAAATEQAYTFTHGAAFVSLAAISAAAFLAPTVLAALDITLQGQRDPREQLLDYLRGKQLLLVLDNFEQLLGPGLRQDNSAADLLADVLRNAPGVALLVTSRERLALGGEWLVDLSGLSYPMDELTSSAETYSAVRLFMQRASQVRRHFIVADGEVRAVSRICQLVEGLPLAIELAAAALRTRSITAIAAAIETNLLALVIELRAVPERQRSIRATFEHSWRLLSDKERQVFARLSVFRGGFEENAAAQVVQASPQLLAALLDKSLLRWDGAARYDMHELVRQYASQKLEELGESGETRKRHAVYYLSVAEAAEPELHGPDQIEWAEQLDRDHDNLRAALHWCATSGAEEQSWRLASSLAPFWEIRGHPAEGWTHLAAALSLNGTQVPSGPHTAARAKALTSAAAFALDRDDFRIADVLVDQGLAIQRELGNQRGIAQALLVRGYLERSRRNYVGSMPFYEESLALFRAVGDIHGSALSLLYLGQIARNQGQYERAEAILNESLALFQQLGDIHWQAMLLLIRGEAARIQGDYARAIAMEEQCLALFQREGAKLHVAMVSVNLGYMAHQIGNNLQAATHCANALSISWEFANKTDIGSALIGLGLVAGVQRPERAARLFAAATKLLDSIDSALEPPDRADYDRGAATVRAALGEKAFAAAWAAGRALPLGQAVAEALEGYEATTLTPSSA